MLSKKTISPVIATALLFVVAVSAVVGFQNFFSSYSSSIFSNVETQNNLDEKLYVDYVSSEVFYLRSDITTNLTTLKIVDDSGNEMCSFSGNGSVDSTGLIGWWKFDNQSSIAKDYSLSGNDARVYANTRLVYDFNDSLAIDRSSYANNGTLNNGVNCAVSGISGNGCSFDGLDDYIQISSSSSINHSVANFSISFWFNSTFAADGKGIISKRASGPFNLNGLGWEVRTRTSQSALEFCINGGSGTCPRIRANFITNNTWHHVVVTVLRNENDSRMYIDGVLVGNMSYAPTYTDTSNLVLGWGHDGYNNGNIDEVALYSKVLTSTEIEELYESQRALFLDYSNSNLDKSIYLDGIDDYAVVSNFTAPNSNELTIFSKVKLRDYPALNSVYLIVESSVNYNANNNTFTQYVSYETAFASFVNFGTSFRQITPTNYSISQANEGIDLNKYYTLIGTFNSSKTNNETMIYKNLEQGVYGTHSAQYNNDTSIYFRNSYPLYISGRAGSAYFFKGEIDEIRIYNRTLSQDEIKNLYWYSFRSVGEGVNELDIQNCSLIRGEKYQAVIFSDRSKVEQYFITK